MTTISEPIMIAGVGGTGSRLAPEAAARLGVKYTKMSNIKTDILGDNSIEISTAPVVNPTVHTIRSAANRNADDILEALGDAQTVIIIANLSGRSGAGIAPSLASICAKEGRKVISFVIMPFRYQKDRIFDSGIALKRLREFSNCTVVVDNDAILEGNPNLGTSSCCDMANSAIMHVIGSIGAGDIPDGSSVISVADAGKSLENSLVDAIKMLYENSVPGSVSRSLLYIMGKDVPVGAIDDAVEMVSAATKASSSAMQTDDDSNGVIMVSEICGSTKFDAYDPLGIIPVEKTLDWDEPERSIAENIDLDQLEK